MKKILLVDDEKPILNMYSEILSDSGFEVETADNGVSAIEKINKFKPDLVYLDIIMPQLNGLDVLKRIKEKKESGQIPVILLTNLPEEASAEKAKSLGAHDYFVKVNFEPEKLAEVTKKIFSKP